MPWPQCGYKAESKDYFYSFYEYMLEKILVKQSSYNYERSHTCF